MRLLFLDLSSRTGFAYGEAGSSPESGSIMLRGPDDAPELGLGCLARWLVAHVREHGKPDLIGVEKFMEPSASRDDHSLIDALRLNGVVHAVAGVYGLSVVQPPVNTIRRQVCGRAFGDIIPSRNPRAKPKRDTKAMVLRTMIMLGYLPKGETDDNRGDAVCGWLYLEANYGRRAPKNFKLEG